MTLEDFHAYCMSLPGAMETFPFDQKTMVFKVGTAPDAKHSKMFALVNIEEFEFVNLKATPEDVVRLCDEHAGTITPGYHMNKKHWVSVAMDESLSDEFIENLINNSYNLIVESLPAKVREAI